MRFMGGLLRPTWGRGGGSNWGREAGRRVMKEWKGQVPGWEKVRGSEDAGLKVPAKAS